MTRRVFLVYIFLIAWTLPIITLAGCMSASADALSISSHFSNHVSRTSTHNTLIQKIPRESDHAYVRLASFSSADQNTINNTFEISENSGLEDYLTYAALNNPGLEASFHRWKAALERIVQATTLPDPRFTYRFFIQEVETRVGPQNQGIRISQTFPWLGKLQLRGDIAAEQAHVAKSRYEAAKLKLFHEVKDVYYELYYLGRAIGLAAEHLSLMKQYESVALTRYKTGLSQMSEVIRAQVELGKLEVNLKSLSDFQKPLVARLNSALNHSMDHVLPLPKTISHANVDIPDEQFMSWLRESNPELIALSHKTSGQQKSIEMAKKNFYPDLSLGIDYTEVGSPSRTSAPGLRNPAALRGASRLASGMGDAIDLYSLANSFLPGSKPDDAGKDVWMLSVSMNLPIWHSKYQAGVREARAGYIASLGERKQLENQLMSQTSMVLYQLHDAERKIDLYQHALIPKARQSLKATETSYRTGMASFLDLVDAERVLLEFEISYERAMSNHGQRLARLEMLVGRSIPTTTNKDMNNQNNP